MRAISTLSFCFLLVHLGFSGAFKREASRDLKPLEWWQEAVVYQIYPRSFQDSNGDGVGDLNGITERADYFVDLGIDTIWISPIFKSPMKDFGYDISDYIDIEPVFGTLDDFKNMSTEFKKRGIKLVLDLVPNHSSDLHEWFNKSVNRIEPYTDYYVWKNATGFDSNGNPIPPNNWVSHFGGSMWEWNDQRQQFYLHQFVKEQPDLNYENIRIRHEILAAVKFWLDLGVEGFRVDAVQTLYEDPEFRDEPPNPDRDPNARPDEWRYYSHIYTNNLPGVTEYLSDIRQLLDIYSSSDGFQRCMMTESVVPDESVPDYYGTDDKPVAHLPFNFHLIDVRPQMNASQILELINVWYRLMPEGRWANFLIGNHDQKRAATRWTEGGIDGANMINLLVQGTPVTYYGEEIGMTDTFLTWEETVDPAACNTDPERYEQFSRDPARTPMQWSNGTGAGFSTTNNTWLPLNPNFPTLNVQAQLAAEESHLKVFKELVKLRKTDAWKYGSYESLSLSNDQILGFTRIPPLEASGPGFLVLINVSDESINANGSVFEGIPANGTVRVRSVNFAAQNVVVGSQINTNAIPLGPRNSIVIEFTPLRSI